MQVPGRDKPNSGGRGGTKLDPERNAFPGSDNSLSEDMDEEMGTDLDEEEDDEPVLDEEDLEENDLSEEEAEDVEWDEPPREGTRKS